MVYVKYVLICMLIIGLILTGCAKQVEQPAKEEPVVEEVIEPVVEEIVEEELEQEAEEEPKAVKTIEPKMPKLVVVRKDIREARYDINYITGEVKNEGTATAKNVKVIASLYDADGELLYTTENMVLDPTLKPGERTTFKIPYDEEDYPELADFEVTVVRGS
ncbi:hypothetical protein GF371_03825 [Candidatus Woesearchaeota archaeon]|nr:hypothetical protein [Candidatus Woesearchaeota archaeon]